MMEENRGDLEELAEDMKDDAKHEHAPDESEPSVPDAPADIPEEAVAIAPSDEPIVPPWHHYMKSVGIAITYEVGNRTDLSYASSEGVCKPVAFVSKMPKGNDRLKTTCKLHPKCVCWVQPRIICTPDDVWMADVEWVASSDLESYSIAGPQSSGCSVPGCDVKGCSDARHEHLRAAQLLKRSFGMNV